MKMAMNKLFNCNSCKYNESFIAQFVLCQKGLKNDSDHEVDACRYYAIFRKNKQAAVVEQKQAAVDGENMSIFDFI